MRWRVSLSCERLNSGEPVLAEIYVDSQEMGDQIVGGLKGADEVVLLIVRCKTMALGMWVQAAEVLRCDAEVPSGLRRLGYAASFENMTTKEQVLQAVQELPDDATFEDAMERLLFLAKIERGVQQADAGQTIPHAQVKEQMAKWLK